MKETKNKRKQKEETKLIKPKKVKKEKLAVKELKDNSIIEKDVKEKNASFSLIEVIIIIIITSIIIGLSTGLIVYKNYNEINKNVEVSKSSKLQELVKVYNNIMESYVEEVDEDKLLNSAIEGMYNYLGDPYTSILDEETTQDLTDRLNGEYEGIGVEIAQMSDGVYILNVFENTPAKEAGLEYGDKIISVDGTDCTNFTSAEVANTIKGSNKTKITIVIKRKEEILTKEINIKKVIIPSVESKNIDGTGYIGLSDFSNTSYNQFKTKLEELEKSNIKGLVIDVRGNGGGYLEIAVDIAKLFLKKGEKIYGLDTKGNIKYYYDETKEERNYKIAVLINSGSASSSEILASALKESYGAILVGETSYGKGTVQEKSYLSSGSMIKYTTAYWLTPDGNNINKKGITPDILSELSYNEDGIAEVDTQLNDAINAIK